MNEVECDFFCRLKDSDTRADTLSILTQTFNAVDAQMRQQLA